MKKQFWYVYLLKCSDGMIYTGCTGDLRRRFGEHERGEVRFTKSRLPVELITYLGFDSKYRAFAFENYLK